MLSTSNEFKPGRRNSRFGGGQFKSNRGDPSNQFSMMGRSGMDSNLDLGGGDSNYDSNHPPGGREAGANKGIRGKFGIPKKGQIHKPTMMKFEHEMTQAERRRQILEQDLLKAQLDRDNVRKLFKFSFFELLR